jgi:hypothetical protein
VPQSMTRCAPGTAIQGRYVPPIAAPGGLRGGDDPPQVPGRTQIAGRPCGGQEALGADPPVGGADLGGHELDDRVGVGRAGRPLGPRSVPPLKDVADGLVGRPAQLGRGAVAAELPIGA